MASLQQIFNWFKTGLIPTEAQFQATFSSFFHKDGKIPISSVENLESQLQGKLASSHAGDENAHSALFGAKAAKDATNIDPAVWKEKLAFEKLKIGFAADGTTINGFDVPIADAEMIAFDQEQFEYVLDEENKTVLLKVLEDVTKLNKPLTDGNWIITIEDGNVNFTNADNLGKNIANTDLTIPNGTVRTLNRTGAQLKVLGRVDKSADASFNKVVTVDSNGIEEISDGRTLIKSAVSLMSQAEALQVAQLLNGGSGSAGNISVNLISPPIVQKIDSNEYILLRGANLNLSAISNKIEIIDSVTGALIVEIPNANIQLYADGTSLIFYYNFKDFAFNTYKIKLTSGPKVYITSLNLQVVQNVNNINVNSLNWALNVKDGVVLPTETIASGSSFVLAVNPDTESSNKVLSFKSDELFPQGSDFYLEINISASSVPGPATNDLARYTIGIGYSDLPNILANKNLVFTSVGLFQTIGVAYYNNLRQLYYDLGPINYTVVFIKTGNLFRTIIGSSNQAVTLSNNSGYSIFLEVEQFNKKYPVSGIIRRAFTFN